MAQADNKTALQRKRRRQMIVQRFFNFAYSIGAAIVIWGALYKILHLPMGDKLLMIGMGTEVIMFIITAFERPEKEYHWEDVFPVLDSGDPDERPSFDGSGTGVIINGELPEGGEPAEGGSAPAQVTITGGGGAVAGTPTLPGGMVVAGPEVAQAIAQMGEDEVRAAIGIPQGAAVSEEESQSLSESISRMNQAGEQLSQMADLADATQQYLSQMSTISEQMQRLSETTTALNDVQQTLLDSYQAITANSEGISSNATGYIEQMEALNRNVGGLNTIYEIQLKSISSQLDSIDRVNRGLKDIRDMYEKSAAVSASYCDETEKMARYMKQLNSVYEKMIKAMTVNMYNPMAAGMMPGVPDPDENTNE